VTGLTRRRFLGSAAAGFGLLPPSLRNVLAATPENRQGSLKDVKHVVYIFQENRSFDHYFGSLSGVRGFDDPTALRLPTGRSVFFQPDPVNPDGYELPFHLDTTTTSAAATSGTDNGWGSQHVAWNGGRMDGWLPGQREFLAPNPTSVMGYFTRQDLPFHYALADAFTICDNYHCSALAQSAPNHLYAISGTIDPDGLAGGPVVNNLPFTGSWTTFYERLQAAGVTWRQYFPNPDGGGLTSFVQFANAQPGSPLYENGLRPRLISDFQQDVLNDRLAQFSRVGGLNDEHPPAHPADGAASIYSVLEALASNPEVWEKTVVFITYDENGGYFDHVLPPTAPPGTPGEYLTVNPLPAPAAGIPGPIGLGFRVPMLVVSPWSRGGWVAGETFDHTSVLRFCEAKFKVFEPNISQWRRRTVGDLTSALRFNDDDARPPLGPILSTLPDTTALAALENQEVATLPATQVPTVQTTPHQEPGHRPHTTHDH
jgi:phospholipase C